MKKIGFWIVMLLLLMLLCIGTKLDSIHLTQKEQQTPKAASLATPMPIEFDIVQHNKQYRLSGLFKDTAQRQRLQKAFADAHHTLQIGQISSDKTLDSEEAIALVESIIPHFTKVYEEGRISFHNRKLTVSGTVHSYDAKRTMERLLNHSTLHTKDNTVVSLPKEEISFEILKKEEGLSMNGRFNSTAETDRLIKSLPSDMRLDTIRYAYNYIDSQKAIPYTEQILPHFAKHFLTGKITYRKRALTVSGLAKDRAALEQLDLLLMQAPCKVINNTELDPQVIAKEEARRKAEEEARRKAEEARRKAEEEARRKAEEEARRKAEEEARRKAEEEAEAAKKNIVALLKVENIEFDFNKDTLTPKGLATVNKLGTILKTYPHIRIEISGHTDSEGDADFNMRLSQTRVDNVKKALVAQGIDAARISAKGYGESKPLVPNDTAENRQKNRRVEITIIGE